MSGAGGSARARYERGRERHRAGRVQRAVLYVMLMGIGLAVVSAWMRGPLDLWIVATLLLVAFLMAWLEPNHVRAWGIGAKGESLTEEELERLPDGYELLHDRRIPGSRGNIDHVVIGPTGVTVVESKRLTGEMRIRCDEVHVRGRNTHMAEQVRGQVSAVRAVLAAKGRNDVPVEPVLFVQRADPAWFMGSPRGIALTINGRQLRRAIEDRPAVLEPDDVSQVGDLLDAALRPMIREPVERKADRQVAPMAAAEAVVAACPRCGNEMVRRRNRQGQAFLGCSQFPNCRGTRPWPA